MEDDFKSQYFDAQETLSEEEEEEEEEEKEKLYNFAAGKEFISLHSGLQACLHSI